MAVHRYPEPARGGSPPGAQGPAGETCPGGPTAAGTRGRGCGRTRRGTFRWVVAPDGELVIPAVTTEGVFITAIAAAYTGEADVTAHWFE